MGSAPCGRNMTGGGLDCRGGSRPGGRRAIGRTKGRGMTSVLAMLYLVLFSALALGFYAQTNLGAQVAGNEERVLAAQVAAESGLQFMRYQVSLVQIAPTVPREQIFENIYNQLSAHMDGTMNLGPRIVGYTAGAAPSIDVPAAPDQFIPLHQNGTRFRATITPLTNGKVRIKTVGRSPGGKITRAIAMDFVESPIRSPVLDYGVATRGQVNLSKGYIYGSPAQSRGSVLTTDTTTESPITLSSGAAIGGEAYLTRAGGWVAGDGSIAGESDPSVRSAYVHPGTAAPEFPSADPSAYISYLVGKETLVTTSSPPSTLSNIRVQAGANPTFAGGGTYDGVILIEAPNVVTFSGGCTVRGVIVVANPDEASAGNKIVFSGGSTFLGPESLPPSYAPLTDMTGTGILAPNFSIEMTGGASSVAGSVLAKGLTISGGAIGTVKGGVILSGTSTLSMSGSGTLTVAENPGAPSIPTGMRFTHTYAPYPATYVEIAQ